MGEDALSEWLVKLIENSGYLGVAFLMFAETVFPPIPSEVIMPLAGLKAAQDQLSLTGVIVAGTVGAVFGNMFWYMLARIYGFDRFEKFTLRYGRWLTMDPVDLHKAQKWFDRWGGTAVTFGRLLPTVRTLVSVPAGVLKMRLAYFLFYTSIGTFIWTMVLALAGYALGSRYTQVENWLLPFSNVVIALIFCTYLWRVIRYGKRHR